MMEKIKPVGYLKTTKSSKSHIPSLIRRETDTKPGGAIPYLIGTHSVLLYNPKLSGDQLIGSLEVLKQDIILRERVKNQPNPALSRRTPKNARQG